MINFDFRQGAHYEAPVAQEVQTELQQFLCLSVEGSGLTESYTEITVSWD